MLQRNSTTNRFRRTRESALTIINPLIDLANIRISALLQQELVDMHKRLSYSSWTISNDLFLMMGHLLSQREDLLRQIRNEVKGHRYFSVHCSVHSRAGHATLQMKHVSSF